ncbi:DUF732 domain-containing protein [Mycetocola reblochoni]|uniref:DUF732 domain-containing protein n=1 Tax=Mycetocola reblochoni TaxID=331618 RepID=UPI00117D417E|nr:DUF732 domain-containing protein [Mycetocola reblochoni]
MNKTAPTVTALAIAALLLTGCSSQSATNGSTAAAPEATAAAKAATATDADAATPEPAAEALSAEDAEFIEGARPQLERYSDYGDLPDAEAIELGHEACDQLEDGVARDDVKLLEESRDAESGVYPSSNVLRAWATEVYCPEFSS